jgi:peptide chain release factor 1
LGGYREITFMVKGDEAWSHFRFESGVHRVQRVPETESQGRIQTSTASVAVLTEADEVEVEIKDSDLVYESCKSSGAGGQHINKTESAVRLTHKPTGIVIECQQERSQFKNKDTALKMLKTKLYDMKQREQSEKIASDRKTQVGSGDRSEKIRTYNYPQSRITDHRIGLTIHSLDSFLNGNIDEMINALIAADTAAKLAAEEN